MVPKHTTVHLNSPFLSDPSGFYRSSQQHRAIPMANGLSQNPVRNYRQPRLASHFPVSFALCFFFLDSQAQILQPLAEHSQEEPTVETQGPALLFLKQKHLNTLGCCLLKDLQVEMRAKDLLAFCF